jgi:hypothetical protein
MLLGSIGYTTISLSSMQNPAPFGSPAGIRATFSTIAGVSPSGTATLMEEGRILGSAVVSEGSATFTTSSLAAGSHNLYVAYRGDTNYASAQSAAYLQFIDRASATVVLGSSENPAPFGTALMLIATTTPGATGTVTFRDEQTILGAASLSNGSAKLLVSNLTAGLHQISASYSGDENYK